MKLVTFRHESDYIVSNGYCDQLEIEIKISSDDGYYGTYEILSLWNDTLSIELRLEDMDIDASDDIKRECERKARDYAYDAYHNRISNVREWDED